MGFKKKRPSIKIGGTTIRKNKNGISISNKTLLGGTKTYNTHTGKTTRTYKTGIKGLSYQTTTGGKTNMSTNNKSKKPFYKKWWFWLICGVIVLSLIVGGNKDDTNESSTASNENNVEMVYPDNEKINEFITSYNEKFDDQIDDVEKGNIRQKCYVSIENCRTELLDADTGNFIIKISGGTTDDVNNHMFEAFKKVLVVIDPTLAESDINTLIEGLKSSNEEAENILNDDIALKYYRIVNLSSGPTQARIELEISNYPINETSNQ